GNFEGGRAACAFAARGPKNRPLIWVMTFPPPPALPACQPAGLAPRSPTSRWETTMDAPAVTGPIANALQPYIHRTRVAYFSMEIALRPEIHTYGGGLGVLAGDTARSAADLNLPMVFVTLISRHGYVRQDLSADGWQ